MNNEIIAGDQRRTRAGDLIMKLVNVVFMILFVVAAILQYNDPDPYIWVPIYLYAALLSSMAIRGRYVPALYYAGLAAYAIYALILFFGTHGVLAWMRDHQAESIVQSMQAEKPWIEAAREFFGLVIVILVLLANMIWLRRRRLPA